MSTEAIALPADSALADVPYAEERAIVEARLGTDAWQELERIESELEQIDQVVLPLHHVFTPGLYLREIFIPKGTLLTTRIHLTEHPFIISAGAVTVWSEEDGCVTLQAPHTGITKPGTRRILYAHTDLIWTTCHVTDKTDPDEIVRDISFTGGKFAALGGAACDRSQLTNGEEA